MKSRWCLGFLVIDSNPVCVCGNTPERDGFFPCDTQGEYCQSVPSWKGHYVCEGCGLICIGSAFVQEESCPACFDYLAEGVKHEQVEIGDGTECREVRNEA